MNYVQSLLSNPQLTTLDLSEKKLNLENYQSLSTFIKKSVFLETLFLPNLHLKNAETILTILDKATQFNTSLTTLKFKKVNLPPNHRLLSLLHKLYARVARNKKRIFAIHGGGNIGLGCMADIIDKSPHYYQIIATSGNKDFNVTINNTHQCVLEHPEHNADQTIINNVTMVFSRDPKNIIDLYSQANLLALCLTESGIVNVIPNIACGLIARYKIDAAGLKILILMNRIDAALFVKQLVEAELMKQINNADEVKSILNTVQFIPTMVDRIVCKAEKNKQLKTPVFIAEKKFSLYVPDYFLEAKKFPHIKVVKDLTQFATIKNRYINGPHAMLAWIGGVMGCDTISEAIQQKSMQWFINKVMEKEIAPVLQAEYPTITTEDLRLLKEAFINRCKLSLKDPIARVGRDPLRKLNQGERIRSIIDLRRKHDLNIPTPELERGIAAGIFYAVKKIDLDNEECEKIREIYRKTRSYQAVLCYKGPYGKGTYIGLDPNKDKTLISHVLQRISVLEKVYQLTNKQ